MYVCIYRTKCPHKDSMMRRKGPNLDHVRNLARLSGQLARKALPWYHSKLCCQWGRTHDILQRNSYPMCSTEPVRAYYYNPLLNHIIHYLQLHGRGFCWMQVVSCISTLTLRSSLKWYAWRQPPLTEGWCGMTLLEPKCYPLIWSCIILPSHQKHVGNSAYCQMTDI